MSDDLARARAWLEAGMAKIPLPDPVRLTPESFRTFLMEAFTEGRCDAMDEFAVERATGQRQLDDATALMTEAKDLFREYESHHRDKVERFPGRPDVPEDVAAFKVLRAKVERNALMAARLEAWLKGAEIYPVTVDRPQVIVDFDGGPNNRVFAVRETTYDDVPGQIGERPDDAHPGFAEGGFVSEMSPVDVPAVLREAGPLETWTPGAKARADLQFERQQACAAAGFIPWQGGDGPPADWDKGDVLLDWGHDPTMAPRFSICASMELHPEPGLWEADRDPASYATIIGYRSSIAKAATPVARVAAEPSPIAALIQARNWLMSAEQLIAAASEHIRGVTGALPGSDSAELCARLDAWLTPMATRPADEGAEKEARRSSVTHQGD